MSKKITTYQDLLDEKQQMEVLLKAQKELIRYDIEQVKAEFRPAINTFGLLGKMFTKDKSNALLNSGADTLIDIVFKRLVLGKAGWVAKLVVPYLVKNVSSHVIAEKREGWVKKLFSMIGKKNMNGKTPPKPTDPASARKDAAS